jgi:hypothetical protein
MEFEWCHRNYTEAVVEILSKSGIISFEITGDNISFGDSCLMNYRRGILF